MKDPPYSADEVGRAFVKHYYHTLHHHPEVALRHYNRSSVISRPLSDGVMKTADSVKGIEDLIRSLDYKEYTVEIVTTDSQKSYKKGVTVLVTGYLMGKHNFRKKFVQSFFLAPQKSGYYVRSDVFRFVDDGDSSETPLDKEFDGVTTSNINSNPEVACVPELDTETESALNYAPKKSYAWAVKVKKESPEIVMTNAVEEARESAEPVQAPSINRSNIVKGKCIYVGNLASSTTVTQLETEFKKFGAVSPGGVLIKHHPEKGYCYAFVNFESYRAVKAAIRASTIIIQGRRAYVSKSGKSETMKRKVNFPFPFDGRRFSGHGSNGYQQWKRVQGTNPNLD